TASNLRVLLPDDNELSYMVYPSIGILDAPALLLIAGIVICLLVAGYLHPLPLLSPVAHAIATLPHGIPEPAHRMAILRAGWLFSAVLMLFYAAVPVCETRTLLSFSAVYPVHVAAYMLFAIASGLLLLISLIQPAALFNTLESIVRQTPRIVMLGIVFLFWWLIFTLLAMWGYRLPVTGVLLVGFWPAAAGYFALLANAINDERRTLQITLVFLRREIAISIALVLWLLAWYAPWQNIITDYWLRTALALLLFVLPGLFLQQWLYQDRPLSRSFAITGGFVLSVTMTALLGLLATLLHLPHTAVIAGEALIGGIALIAVLWYGKYQPPASDDSNPAILTLVMLVAVVGMVLFSRLPFSYMHYEAFAGDYWTQTAYTTYYAESDSYQFHEVLLGTETATPPRLWFYFWPLTPAVIGQLTHIHTATQLKLIGPLMAALSLLCTYGLARAFHLKRSLAWLAVLLQMAGLLLLLNPFETGQSFMQWATIDKIVGTFILAPVLFRVLFIFLENPNRRYFAALVLAAFALPFTHAVVTALTALIIGVFLVFDVLATRR
ncbi:MAG: hypothetical protein KC496_12275, partial [Anaerolineae bacterium]|nr:hypothetical protein [Anaerolineae bacterium]